MKFKHAFPTLHMPKKLIFQQIRAKKRDFPSLLIVSVDKNQIKEVLHVSNSTIQRIKKTNVELINCTSFRSLSVRQR